MCTRITSWRIRREEINVKARTRRTRDGTVSIWYPGADGLKEEAGSNLRGIEKLDDGTWHWSPSLTPDYARWSLSRSSSRSRGGRPLRFIALRRPFAHVRAYIYISHAYTSKYSHRCDFSKVGAEVVPSRCGKREGAIKGCESVRREWRKRKNEWEREREKEKIGEEEWLGEFTPWISSFLDPTGSGNGIVYPLHLVDEERTLRDRFKRALRPRRTCSSKLYKTRLHASAMSLALCKRVLSYVRAYRSAYTTRTNIRVRFPSAYIAESHACSTRRLCREVFLKACASLIIVDHRRNWWPIKVIKSYVTSSNALDWGINIKEPRYFCETLEIEISKLNG